MNDTTTDTVYQGRVTLVQPAAGFRAGFDSLALAASLPDIPGGQALELGCGAGGALLPAASRRPDMVFTGLEQDGAMAELAREGVRLNGFGGRVSVLTGEASAWVRSHENVFDLVFANPPFFEAQRTSPPGEGKAAAYLESLPIEDWIKAMVFTAKPRAPVILIHHAAQLARLLVPLDRQAGEITVLPIASKAAEPARRVLVRARKGLRRGGLRLLPPLVTHTDEGTTRTAAAEAVAQGLALDW